MKSYCALAKYPSLIYSLLDEEADYLDEIKLRSILDKYCAFMSVNIFFSSLSDDATKLGRPNNFTVNIREVYPSAGAGFVVALTGAIMTMPGLPKEPAAYQIDVTDEGVITGLF